MKFKLLYVFFFANLLAFKYQLLNTDNIVFKNLPKTFELFIAHRYDNSL